MSKTPQRRAPAGRRSSGRKEPQIPVDNEARQRFLVFLAVLVLAGGPFILGKYFEFNSPGAFDSGSYVYSAQHILSGARVGAEEKPSAQAGTLLVNMLGVRLFGFSETGSKLLQMIFQAVALLFLFVTARRLYGTIAGVLGMTVASVFLSAPLIAKYGNVKEQFMIAFMICGICCFVYYHLTGRWWWAVLTGAVLVCGPMFKQTGLSAIAAVGLFTLAGPVFRRFTWAQAGKDIVFLLVGAIAVLVPIDFWYAKMKAPIRYWPYSFVIQPALSALSPGDKPVPEPGTPAPAVQSDKPQRSIVMKLLPGYVRESWEALSPEARAEARRRVLRYYRLLILPIVLALGAILARLLALLRPKPAKQKGKTADDNGRFVLLFALWWIFDMAFVWISPRSYEQYYLPLNASGAMLGAYLAGCYAHKLRFDADRSRWVVLGLLGIIVMTAMSWHIFFGIAKSPHSDMAYKDPQSGQPRRTRGYLQKWQEVSQRSKAPWEQIGEYIRQNSQPTDTIYVWGWVPGIYVQAQRLSSAPKAFEGTMHTLAPTELSERVKEILDAFAKKPPVFIVDTRKTHFPWDRPPLELWPRTQRGFLPADDQVMTQYEQLYSEQLREKIEPAEAERFAAMRPFRQYVMRNYTLVSQLGDEVLFKRK